MSRKTTRFMIEVRDGDEWHPCWMSFSDERERTKLGMKLAKAKLIAEELMRPVTGYEFLGKVPHPELCRRIRGYGMPKEDVRIVPFRKGTWKKTEDSDAA